ncbi:MAG: GNAT family N-acetyltransferase [Phycisphaerae bacterium]|jgi:GNAT superfamily N-acetyltransferase
MSDLTIRHVPAEATHALRQRVLRPHQPISMMDFAGDRNPGTTHLAAIDPADGQPLGIASIYLAPPLERFHPASPLLVDGPRWQLRGMATDPAIRGTGWGRRLLLACLAHAKAHGGTVMWCDARVEALPFYERMNFLAFGDEYTPPGLRPHRFMWRAL